jgi:TonB family protein
MKKLILILVCLFFSATLIAQNTKTSEKDTVYAMPEKMPQFPGGDQALIDYLKKNIKYPAKAKEEKIEGMVFVTFIVDKTGTIRDVKVLRGVSEDINGEAVSVVSKMPAWQPGEHKGENVSVVYNLPIKFELD